MKNWGAFSTHEKFGENGIFSESWKVWGRWQVCVSLWKFGENGISDESWKVWGKWHFGWILESLRKMAPCLSLGKFGGNGTLSELKSFGKWHFRWVGKFGGNGISDELESLGKVAFQMSWKVWGKWHFRWVLESLGKMALWVNLEVWGKWHLVWVLESLGKMAFHVSLGKFGENGTLGESWKVWGKWHFKWVLKSLGKMALCVNLDKFRGKWRFGELWKVYEKWYFGWILKIWEFHNGDQQIVCRRRDLDKRGRPTSEWWKGKCVIYSSWNLPQTWFRWVYCLPLMAEESCHPSCHAYAIGIFQQPRASSNLVWGDGFQGWNKIGNFEVKTVYKPVIISIVTGDFVQDSVISNDAIMGYFVQDSVISNDTITGYFVQDSVISIDTITGYFVQDPVISIDVIMGYFVQDSVISNDAVTCYFVQDSVISIDAIMGYFAQGSVDTIMGYLVIQDHRDRDRRRHSSADDFRTRVLERRALERKDSNHSESSEGSQELRGVLRKDSSHSDSTDSRQSDVKLDEDVFKTADQWDTLLWLEQLRVELCAHRRHGNFICLCHGYKNVFFNCMVYIYIYTTVWTNTGREIVYFSVCTSAGVLHQQPVIQKFIQSVSTMCTSVCVQCQKWQMHLLCSHSVSETVMLLL